MTTAYLSLNLACRLPTKVPLFSLVEYRSVIAEFPVHNYLLRLLVLALVILLSPCFIPVRNITSGSESPQTLAETIDWSNSAWDFRALIYRLSYACKLTSAVEVSLFSQIWWQPTNNQQWLLEKCLLFLAIHLPQKGSYRICQHHGSPTPSLFG